jgi:hypothetical protein
MDAIVGSDKLGYWPSAELLRSIDQGVGFLALCDRKGSNSLELDWKVFKRLDKRLTHLQLDLKVNNLIGRAHDKIIRGTELAKAERAAMEGNAQAQCSFRAKWLTNHKLIELLSEYRQVVIQRYIAQPLVEWLFSIKHPKANDIVELPTTVEELKGAQRRDRRRVRGRRRAWRYRQKKTLPKKRHDSLTKIRGKAPSA